jgi:ABC-type glutathione transport system ATPase component
MNTLPAPARLQNRLNLLLGQRDLMLEQRSQRAADLAAVNEYLNIADAVDEALDKLSEQLFGKIVGVLEQNLTLALADVLEQSIQLKVDRSYKRGAATLSFHVERDGHPEDIMKGQGGSVANVLSVGLRMFALKTLDPDVHRRFLVLDEQDCWLRPDLVPRLVKIVHEAGRELGFQVLMISHHDSSAFEKYADKIYEIKPTPHGVEMSERKSGPANPDK